MMLRIRSRRNGIVGVMLLGLVMASAVFLLRGQGRVEATAVDWMQGEPALVDERPFGMFDGDEWSRSDCVVKQWTVLNERTKGREKKHLCVSQAADYEIGQSGREVYVRQKIWRPSQLDVFLRVEGIGYLVHRNGTDTAFIGSSRWVFGRGEVYHVIKLTDFSNRLIINKEATKYTLNTQNPAYRLADTQSGAKFAYGWGVSNNGRYLAYGVPIGGYGVYDAFVLADTETGEEKMFGRGYYTDEYSYEPLPEFVVSNDGVQVIAGGNGAFKMWRIADDCKIHLKNYDRFKTASDPCPSRVITPRAHAILGKLSRSTTYRLRASGDFTKLSYFLDGVHTDGRRAITLSVPNYYPHGQLDYLAMGDSYSSGEGDIEADGGYYLEGTERRGRCHVSRRSYPFLLSDTWKMRRGKFRSIACSGARILPDYIGRLESYRGQSVSITGSNYYDSTPEWALSEFRQGYVPQIEFVKRYKPKVVTLTGGGNDVGFADILKYCAFPAWESLVVTINSSCRYASDESAKQELKNSIRNQYRSMRNTIRKIKMMSPETKIYLIGYPQFINNPWLSCGYNTASLDRSERSMIREMVKEMNNVLWRAASDEGVPFIDIENSLEGGQLCAGGKYVTGLYNIPIYYKPNNGIQEIFHPNAAGHRKMSEDIAKRVPMPLGDNEWSQRDALSGDEYAGSPFSLLTQMVKGVAIEGKKLIIEFKSKYLKIGSNVSIAAYSSEVRLGSAIVNSGGAVNAEFDIPANLGIGNHALVLRGVDIDNRPITLYQFFTVRSAIPNDMDGDGILDDEDNCQFIREWYDERTGENVCAVKAADVQRPLGEPSSVKMQADGGPQSVGTTSPRYAILAATGMNAIKGIIIPLLLLLGIAVGAILIYAREQYLIRKGLRRAHTRLFPRLTRRQWQITIVVLLAMIPVMLIADLFTLRVVPSTIGYYTKWAECGGRPFITRQPYKSYQYYTRSNELIQQAPLLEGGGVFFCTTEEAEAAGYYKKQGE